MPVALPLEATGVLGALDLTSGARSVLVFDTSTGIYSIDGVAMNDETLRRSVDLPGHAQRTAPPIPVWVFDFSSIHVGPSVTVLVQGD
ncbi:MAG TPA: hypothetical protein VNX21_06355, partial [Candidatus Thermoplasmatota archaeon]|nr:hypothetical protein [Candidatus Thermoplasmatota archaeon]